MNNVANSYCDKSTLTEGIKYPAVRFTATLRRIST